MDVSERIMRRRRQDGAAELHRAFASEVPVAGIRMSAETSRIVAVAAAFLTYQPSGDQDKRRNSPGRIYTRMGSDIWIEVTPMGSSRNALIDVCPSSSPRPALPRSVLRFSA